MDAAFKLGVIQKQNQSVFTHSSFLFYLNTNTDTTTIICQLSCWFSKNKYCWQHLNLIMTEILQLWTRNPEKNSRHDEFGTMEEWKEQCWEVRERLSIIVWHIHSFHVCEAYSVRTVWRWRRVRLFWGVQYEEQHQTPSDIKSESNPNSLNRRQN